MRTNPPVFLLFFLPLALPVNLFAGDALPQGVWQNLVLAPGDDNPRNSEGDFVHLKDGRVLFVYSHFTGRKGTDGAAYLASRISADQGKTWSDRDVMVIDGKTDGAPVVMSVSLLRLADGRIALFYLAKKTEDDCRLMMRTSADEALTWNDSKLCTAGPGYFLVANGRVIQLKSGRIIFPAARHDLPESADGFHRGTATCFYSDDKGETWHENKGKIEAPAKSRSGFQYPAIVELKDGRLMMLLSMHLSPLLRSYSADGGETWSAPQNTGLLMPVSATAIRRVPSTGDLLMVWNDHAHAAPSQKNDRTPLTVAVSFDDGKTWERRKNLYDDPDGFYSFAAIDFVGDRVLLGHCASRHARGAAGMATTVITSFDLNWLDH